MKIKKTIILFFYCSSAPLANVENTPMKKVSKEVNISISTSSTSKEIIEETPIKDENNENDSISSDKMSREIQRLSHRLRSSIPGMVFIILSTVCNLLFLKCMIILFMIINRLNQQLFIFLK